MTTDDTLDVLRGRIENLTVVADEEEFLQAPSKQMGTATASALAVAGVAGAASGALLATTGSADAVQRFTCSVAGELISGCFSTVGFNDGDEVEVVGARQPDRSYYAYAVRRPEDRKLWMHPHCSRGSKAHWRYTWKMVAVTIAVGILIFEGVSMSSLDASDIIDGTRSFWMFFWGALVFSIVLGLYLPLRFAFAMSSSVAIAERIFAALGYADPANVDMEKQNFRYWRKTRGRYEVGGWVFRYIDER
jgi:hypothetical protein